MDYLNLSRLFFSFAFARLTCRGVHVFLFWP